MTPCTGPGAAQQRGVCQQWCSSDYPKKCKYVAFVILFGKDLEKPQETQRVFSITAIMIALFWVTMQHPKGRFASFCCFAQSKRSVSVGFKTGIYGYLAKYAHIHACSRCWQFYAGRATNGFNHRARVARRRRSGAPFAYALA